MAGNDLLRSRADAAVLSRDFALAARLYNTLLQQSPDDVELLEKMGSIFVKSGDDKKALSYYTKINQIKPNDFNTLNSLGGIYRRLKQYENSIEVLKEALKLNQKVDQVNYNLGFTYKFMEKYDEAVDCFESVIQANPTDVLAYNHLGTIYQKRGENQKAIQTFLKALKVDRNHPILHLNLAKSYEQENQIANAVAEYEAALRSKPGWKDAISDYSKLLLSLNKTKEAKELVTQALSVDPQNVSMHSTMGKIYLLQSDYENSTGEYKKALAIDPNYKSALIGISEALEDNGNAVQAIEYIEKVEKANPDDSKILKRSASVNLSANRVSTASVKIKTLLNKNKDDVEALDLAGQFFIVKNEDAKASNFYKKIQELNPQYVKHWLKASSRYRQIGKLDKAESAIKRYLQKNPEDSKAITNLALISESLGKTSEALANFKKALHLDPNNVTAKQSLLTIADHISDLDTEEDDNIFDEAVAEAQTAPAGVETEDKDDESLIEKKIADDTALVDDEASSTDSELWKSESWDADQLVEENDDPFSLLDGNDESVLTGPSASTEDNEENLLDDIPDEMPKAMPTLDNLADPEIANDNYDGNGFDAGKVNDEDFGGSFDEEDITPENMESSLADDFGNELTGEDESVFDEVSDDGMSDFDSLDTSLAAQKERFPKKEKLPQEPQMPRYIIQQPQSSGLSAEDAVRLMNSMQKTQEEANKAIAAAEKAWMAANHAADAAQAASDSENSLTEMATDAVMQAAEKVRMQAEEIAKEATDKALAERMDKIDSILPQFEKMLEEKDTVPDQDDEQVQKALSLFKSLRALGASLPGDARTNFMQSSNRMRMDYIIGRLSGNMGLLKMSQNLRDSGELENCVREEEVPVSYKGKRLAADVLRNMSVVSRDLEDKDLSIGLEKIITGLIVKLK
ncbi:tetratricopeptide repeat protein [Treponema sp.]|uniref:tetratricopeptide repeat protein n=1 Tax=Treponema sp. TaxID=166 RepID=UPI00298E135D|nr:tetratricopeptide repeat protein [Treponema sp.]